ncbi:Uma2 family endonuclease [Symbioplanes lichenis]|uniref:Uma2 family endonuclease n=1 Tax=Symbioplanes lichenis TaxID=1629072 RepID=UPI00273A2D82|nr:Uma2 family endonuclease [Actinoplanes lichenis]
MTVVGQSIVRHPAPDGPWTEPDLHHFAQDGHRYEIVDGSLHVTPPQEPPHDTVVAALVATLRAAAPEGWWVCDRLGVALGASNLIPDVTVLRPHSSGSSWAAPGDVALVVEVVSASTRAYDELLKPALYARAGIGCLWRVVPGADPVVHALGLGNAGYEPLQTAQGADPVRIDAPFPVRVAPGTWV